MAFTLKFTTVPTTGAAEETGQRMARGSESIKGSRQRIPRVAKVSPMAFASKFPRSPELPVRNKVIGLTKHRVASSTTGDGT